MTDQLGNQHRIALLTLMGIADKVSNSDLQAIAGFRITGEVRMRLVKEGLITSERVGNAPFVLELTRDGWTRCAKELTAERLDSSRHLGAAFYLVLSGVDRFLKREGRELLDMFRPVPEISPDSMESSIRIAYRKLARNPRDEVRLADLRPMLNGAGKADADAVLKAMSRAGKAKIYPDANRKVLTDADRAAAVTIGGEDNHLIVIEES
jgi:hypothetical protein